MNDAAGLAANYDDRRYNGGEGRVKRWTRMARNARAIAVGKIRFADRSPIPRLMRISWDRVYFINRH